MAINPTGLGKGLDALIRETHEARDGGGIKVLPLDDIIPNPNQPRRAFSEKALEELASSIKSQGLLQPLLVRPLGPGKPDTYEIVAGERRWRASRLAGLTEVPVMIRSLSAQETLTAALIENLQREDLNPLEEALGLQALKEEFGLSQDDIAQKLGKSRSAIANSLRLLSLPESMRPLLAEGKLSAGHARALLSVTEPKSQEYLKNLILENRLSVREAEGLASSWKDTGKFELVGLPGEPSSGPHTASDAESAEQNEYDTTIRQNERIASPETDARKFKPQSARILEIQNRIGEIFQVPVKVTGKEDKGRISLTYNSREELESLLERLSNMVLEGTRRTPLMGRSLDVLDGSTPEAITGAAFEILPSAGHDSLNGATNSVLEGTQNAALQSTKRQALTGSGTTALESHGMNASPQTPSDASADADQKLAEASDNAQANLGQKDHNEAE